MTFNEQHIALTWKKNPLEAAQICGQEVKNNIGSFCVHKKDDIYQCKMSAISN